MGKFSLAVSVSLTAAQIASNFAPVPYLGPAVDVLCSIVAACAQVSYNSYSARQLRDRCEAMLYALKDSTKIDPAASSTKDALYQLESTLFDIKTNMERWAALNRIQSFARQAEIAQEMHTSHAALTDCMNRFQITAQLDILEWQEKFNANQRRDHQELLEYLADIQHSQDITNVALQDQGQILFKIMAMMQNGLGEPGEAASNGLQSNLYQLQMMSKTLLPDFNLKRGEVRRISSFPVGTTTTGLDVWEGIYLNREKVAIKMLRAVRCGPDALRRFKREVDIWGKVWNLDQGQHILPFYGFCQNDGPYPYMVSPWQSNGSAIKYVKKYPHVDHMQLIRGIGEGIRILHTMDPPIAHGEVRGLNIMINQFGQPLLSDFGVSRMVEDMTGVPFTHSTGVNESYRWFAPEMLIGEGSFSTASDIYSFAMTMLELLTHDRPFSRIKHTTEVVIHTSRGRRPQRPNDPSVEERGLSDDLWEIMKRCWAENPKERPSIQEVLSALPA
ncbi:hypothetical protein PLICRDRAFT_99108 [Plicaturopsis crispa FD-325 SS-3]|nr:hypothetical protein PLICRDRAFT_99108 [Plicaturopsis crispa FD-325 SS-3]